MTGGLARRAVDFEIIEDDSCCIDSSLRRSTNIVLDDLKMNLGGETMIFNSTWLRDSCHCNQCTHPHSRQRLYTAKDFRQDHFRISQVELVSAKDTSALENRIIQGSPDKGLIKIEWSDGHLSFYSLDWLNLVQDFASRRHLDVPNKRQKSVFQFPKDDFYLSKSELERSAVHWTVDEISKTLQSVDYNDLLDGFKFNNETTFINANRLSDMSSKRSAAVSKLSANLVEFGLAKLVNVPCQRDHVLKVAKSLAYERPTGYGVVFDVVVEPSEHINLAYSSREFDLHTDLPYREMSPGVQLLHCISNTSHGGLSYFSDAFKAAATLRTEHPLLFDTLVQFPITFVVKDPYRNMKFRRHQPMIQLDHSDKLEAIHYSPFTLPPIGHCEDVKLFYLAQDVFTNYLQASSSKLITKMEPGDLYIFNNRRVLHGRSGYDATKSRRFLQGCYMDWDEITAFDEKLQTQNLK